MAQVRCRGRRGDGGHVLETESTAQADGLNVEGGKKSFRPSWPSPAPPKILRGTEGWEEPYPSVRSSHTLMCHAHPPFPPLPIAQDSGSIVLEPRTVQGELWIPGFHLQSNCPGHLWSCPGEMHSVITYSCARIHSFIQQILTEPPICVQHCARLCE